MTQTILGKLGVPEDTTEDELADMIEQWEREQPPFTAAELAEIKRVVKKSKGNPHAVVDYFLRKIMALDRH